MKSAVYVVTRTELQGFISMKKIICVFLSLTVLITSIFADKSRYYNKEEYIVDIMYVTSEEGLRVRDKTDELAFNIDNCALNGFNTDYIFAVHHEFGKKYDEVYHNGVFLDLRDEIYKYSGKYAADYGNYWHPIIIEHQKKADAME